ncbi:MAG: hypothetical protein V2J12_13125 [Gammaproteobacteria bacterium]|jgi:hypothetical protein|nr:hypothetical protein [Gammaproteobacteria bacterium]
MATLVSPRLRRDSGAEDDQEQLLKLFWNRAELKKGFDKLRRESAQMADQLSKQEALTLKIQQRIDKLEAQLSNPISAARVVTYYQLRGIWVMCEQRLQAYARELQQGHHAVESRRHVQEFQRALNESLIAVQCDARRASEVAEALAAEIARLHQEVERRRGFWNVLKRRKLAQLIEARVREQHAVERRRGELNAEIKARSAAESPSFPGLSVKARRQINLHLIALAQELTAAFEADKLAELAREAMSREPADVRYGSRRDCRALRRLAEERRQAVSTDAELIKRCARRAARLQGDVQYRNDADTVPIASSIGPMMSLGETEVYRISSVNVLSDEYWGLFNVLVS